MCEYPGNCEVLVACYFYVGPVWHSITEMPNSQKFLVRLEPSADVKARPLFPVLYQKANLTCFLEQPTFCSSTTSV